MLLNLWISWMTASVFGRFARSSIVGGLDCPIKLSISDWTFSVYQERTCVSEDVCGIRNVILTYHKFLKEFLCSTLDLGVFGHVEEGPAQGGGRGLRAGHKQIHHTNNQVFLIKSTSGLALTLARIRHDTLKKYQQMKCCKSMKPHNPDLCAFVVDEHNRSYINKLKLQHQERLTV